MNTTELKSNALERSKMLSKQDVEEGSPELAYMGARRMKGLWRSRSHDLDGWREAIDQIAPEDAPKAWEQLPDPEKPYRTARAFIEAEVHPSYDQMLSYVEIMLGIDWAKRIAENYADRPGAPDGNQNAAKNNRYAHNDCLPDKQRGTSKAYLLEQLPVEVVAEIGEGKKFKTVHEAARKTGVINVPPRYYIPSDPENAGRFLAKTAKVDSEWIQAMLDAYMKALAS